LHKYLLIGGKSLREICDNFYRDVTVITVRWSQIPLFFNIKQHITSLSIIPSTVTRKKVVLWLEYNVILVGHMFRSSGERTSTDGQTRIKSPMAIFNRPEILHPLHVYSWRFGGRINWLANRRTLQFEFQQWRDFALYHTTPNNRYLQDLHGAVSFLRS